ncbi:MAG TPA: hypothetical protein VLV83_12235 [Acidobacteriota bacterium]|nr:hypothetical protein [Acidobacteriota bacterium]
MSTDCKLFPAKLKFPPATQDVARLVGDEHALRLTADAVGFERLASHAAVRVLWCFGIGDERLEILAQCQQLEALYLEDVRVPSLEALGALGSLDALGVDGATRVESLDWLAHVPALSHLRLQGLPRVHSLESLSTQPGLKALDVSGSTWTRMKVDSFAGLAELSELRVLYLTNIQCLDGSLDVLAGLPYLQELHIAGFYPWEEFARLSGLRPDLRCDWLEPFVELKHQSCDACGGQLVLLTGKRQPTLCRQCKADRIQRHADRFLRVAHEAARQGAAGDPAR